MSSNYLKIGQRLKVKRMPDVVVDETQYAVKEGDTMFSIAQKFNLSVEQLKKLNNLESNMLFERMVLKVKP
jgi:LysM repeat protein